MANFITIDSGTTNTRIHLVCNEKIVASKKISLGVGDRDVEIFKKTLRTEIYELLWKSGLQEKDIERIIASGMITSEYGLCNLSHIVIPAGIKELHGGIHEAVFKDVSSVPIVFIRGVKAEGESLEVADMMRGEETELMGILGSYQTDATYVFPGSHSKLIRVDEQGRIVDIRTMLTGEMIAALSGHTLLRDAVDLNTSEIDESYLIDGYEYCRRHGINEALFKVRVLKNIFSAGKKETYSFFLGAVLTGELQCIANSEDSTIVISGQSQLANAMCVVLRNCCDKGISIVASETVKNSTVLGALKIYRGI